MTFLRSLVKPQVIEINLNYYYHKLLLFNPLLVSPNRQETIVDTARSSGEHTLHVYVTYMHFPSVY